MTNQSEVEAYGCLRPDCPFGEIFPSGIVPLESVKWTTLRHPEAPPCYVVDSNRLSEEQIIFLAKLIYEIWHPQCKDLNQAIAYIQDGLPLNIDWFVGVGGDYKCFAEKNAMNKQIS
jgi:hypothetical protein